MAAANPVNEKIRNLPLVCVETIFKFTPTSKLIRLCSIAVPLPGAFWSLGLETVLIKRSLSLRDDSFCPLDRIALYDFSGATVASIRNPEAFQFSAVLELIGSATMAAEMVRLRGAPLQFRIVHGDALLSHLPNVNWLELVLQDREGYAKERDLLEPCLKHLRPRLHSVFISYAYGNNWILHRQASEEFDLFINALRIGEMNGLRRLASPVTSFDCVLGTFGDRSSPLQSVLAGVTSLAIGHRVYYDAPYYNASADPIFRSTLNLVPLRCGQLSQLTVEVHGEFRAYLAAFRQLPLLTFLGLDVWETNLTGLTLDGRDAIGLVSHLRIIFQPFRCTSPPTIDGVLKIATFFPNVKAVEVMANREPRLLELATSFFGQAKLFPAAATLRCFYPLNVFHCATSNIKQFLANPHLPEAVDLSHIIFEDLARDSGTLAAIYCAMQRNSIKSLLLSGPLHRDALLRLQGHIENSTKVFAWKVRDLDDQPGISVPMAFQISEQTDFKIVGRKTSGNLKNEEFTIRVFRQHPKQTCSWYFSMM